MKPKIDPVLEDAVKYRPMRPRGTHDADMGTETARFRHPAKPPPARRVDALGLQLVPGYFRGASEIGEALPAEYHADRGPGAGATVETGDARPVTAAGLLSGWGPGALERRATLEA